jgi:hypothetical protein
MVVGRVFNRVGDGGYEKQLKLQPSGGPGGEPRMMHGETW